MRRIVGLALCIVVWTGISAGTMYAWDIKGFVECPNNTVFENVTITVTGTAPCFDGNFSKSATTDAAGFYFISLPDCGGDYTATIDTSNLPPDAVVTGGNTFSFTLTVFPNDRVEKNWEVNTSACAACWFTGGGAKIDQLVDIPVAVRLNNKPKTDLSFGGNVYPGCSPTAGDGGSWNHVDRILNLHFHGTTIHVVQCGNVPGIPPGSTSPATPFNFIDFEGTGTLKGIQGNKSTFPIVCFRARAEDRNEPGSSGAKDGALIDRYFLRVYNCDTGETYLLVSKGGTLDPADTLAITDGNFQIHVSSCDKPPSQ